MTFSGRQTELTNWTRSAYSQCFLYQSSEVSEIVRALEAAREQHLTVIPHGAGHSYTDAALNTRGVVIDVTPMRGILSGDADRGVMRGEPGVTLQEMVRVASQDGWWPYAAPSTAEATIGGCTAMNVNGRNAWKWGPFGAHVLALDMLLASGDLFYDKLLKLLRAPTAKRAASNVVSDTETAVAGYLVATALINLGQAVAVGLALWIIGMDSQRRMKRWLQRSALLEHLLLMQSKPRRQLNPTSGSPFYIFIDHRQIVQASGFLGDADWQSFVEQMAAVPER